jgi:hypothetical protein
VVRLTLTIGLALHLFTITAVAAPPTTAHLHTLITDLDRLAQEVLASTSSEAATIADRLPERWIVVDGTDRFEVSSRALVTALRSGAYDAAAWASRKSDVAAQIEAMRDEAATLLQPHDRPDSSVAGAALAEVLSAPEFRHRPGWLSELRKRVDRWLKDLAEALGLGHITRSRVSRVLIWIVTLAALGLLVFWLGRTLRHARRDTGFHFGPPVVVGRASREWVMRALHFARGGDLREAVRCAYQAVVVRLEEDGVWRVDEARTPREYLRLLRTTDRRHPALADATRRFERVWYGGVAPQPDDAREMIGRLRELGCDLPAETAI